MTAYVVIYITTSVEFPSSEKCEKSHEKNKMSTKLDMNWKLIFYMYQE